MYAHYVKNMAQLIKEAKRMQQLAGIINESQLNEEEIKSVDQALNNPKVQAASEKLMQDPALLQKAIGELTKLGIDKNTLVKAAQSYKAGQSVDNIIEPKVEKITTTLKEEERFSHPDLSPEDLKAAGKGGAKVGGALGAVVGLLGGGIIGTAAFPAALVTAAILGALGAIQGSISAKRSTYNDAVRARYNKEEDEKNQQNQKIVDTAWDKLVKDQKAKGLKFDWETRKWIDINNKSMYDQFK